MDCVLGEGRTAVSKPNTPRAHSGPVRIFGAVWGERGVAEFKLRLQADFNLGFTRPAPQAGVRRIKNQSKIDAKSMQEKGMQKVCKMMPKCIQNGSQNPSKI